MFIIVHYFLFGSYFSKVIQWCSKCHLQLWNVRREIRIISNKDLFGLTWYSSEFGRITRKLSTIQYHPNIHNHSFRLQIVLLFCIHKLRPSPTITSYRKNPIPSPPASIFLSYWLVITHIMTKYKLQKGIHPLAMKKRNVLTHKNKFLRNSTEVTLSCRNIV